ncbi:MAG: GatB/YqeY domain-containing protein [Flavobacteriales bacterium]|jgi:uncharacterized protein YqeY
MNITERINNDIKEAMKARESGKLAALRDIKSKLLLEATKEGGSGEVDEDGALKILNKLYKQRVEAAEIYQAQGREDLLADELAQAEVIKAYLPAQLSEAELRSSMEEIIARVGASSMADMGKVMGAATKELAGKADGKAISAMVKALLG